MVLVDVLPSDSRDLSPGSKLEADTEVIRNPYMAHLRTDVLISKRIRYGTVFGNVRKLNRYGLASKINLRKRNSRYGIGLKLDVRVRMRGRNVCVMNIIKPYICIQNYNNFIKKSIIFLLLERMYNSSQFTKQTNTMKKFVSP